MRNTNFRTLAFRSGSTTLGLAALALIVVILFNLLLGALPESLTHLDTTANSVYAFSQETYDLLAALEEDVSLYCVVANGSEDATIDELMARYAAKSEHIHVEYIDPVLYPNFTAAYTTATLEQGSIIVESARRHTIINHSDLYAYALNYTTYVYDTYLAGESVITSAIDYVTSDALPKVYALSGHGELSFDSNLSSAIARQNISVETLSLIATGEIPDDCQCLILLSPVSDLGADEADMILSYLQSGGNLLIFTDYTEESMPNLHRILENYGVTRGNGIIIEGDSNHYLAEYTHYLLPQIESHSITEPLRTGGYYVLVPIAEPILTPDNPPRDSITYAPLLTSTDKSFRKMLTDYQLPSYSYEEGDVYGPFTVGLAVTEDLVERDPGAEELHELSDAEQTRIVYFSSSYLMDSSLSSYVAGANEDLILNALDWMTDREDSISISAKLISMEYLSLSAADTSIGAILAIGLPVIALGIGIVVIIRRRRRKV